MFWSILNEYLHSIENHLKLLTRKFIIIIIINAGTYPDRGTNVEQDAFIEQDMCAAMDIDN